MVLAESCPQRPNMSMLYRELETNRNLGLKMLDALERSELVMAIAPEKGDFLVDGKYLFEIGGARKGFDQIKDLPNSFVVNDDTEVGFGNKIPLWLFGFLY